MRDLKIKPGMDTPKAKLKNPAPKDADSLLKQHMDKRQREKSRRAHDPVRYATDRVEKTMRRGAAGAADTSRRMIKHYRGKLRQGKKSASGSHTAADMGIGSKPRTSTHRWNMPFLRYKPLHEMKSETGLFFRKIAKIQKSTEAAPQERGRQKAAQDAKAAYRRNLAEEKNSRAPLYLHGPTVEAQ